MTLLLVVIYITFIGLGIPDSLFGPAWPAIYTEFSLPISYAGYVTATICAGTVISSLLSARIIRRFGTGAVTAVSTAMTALALLGFSRAGGFAWFLLLAVPLGLGAGSIDAALNNYVALHCKASHMNFLHCFYGIGVTVSPALISRALAGSGGWRGGYRAAFAIQLAITLVTVLALPLWAKHGGGRAREEKEKPLAVPLPRLLGQRKVRLACLLFFAYCAMEVTAGNWASTFLVSARGLSAQTGAGLAALYYGGMALGRLLSGLLSGRLRDWQLIRAGEGLSLLALALLLIPGPAALAGAGLLLLGVGNGPIFPNMVHATPESFGRELSQSVIGAQMAFAYVGSMLAPPLFGQIAQRLGAGLYPVYMLVFFALLALATLLLRRALRAEGRL